MSIEPKITGIYKIVNTVNGHKYVGSGMSVKGRWRTHLHCLRKNKHHSPYLQRAWNKYGEEAFEFIVIEECEPIKEVLLEREQFWIDELHAYGKTGYNGTPKAANSLGYKHTEESKKKISEANKDRPRMSDEMKEFHRQRMIGNKFRVGNTTRKGAKCTPEQIEKNRVSHLGIIPSEEARRNMSAAQIGRKMSDEAKAKISAGLRGKALSTESIEKRTESRMANRISDYENLTLAFLELTAYVTILVPLAKLPNISDGKVTLWGIKYCARCKEPKQNDCFNKSSNNYDGISSYCKECVSIMEKERCSNINNEHDERDNDQPKLCNRCKLMKTKGDFGRFRRTSDGLDRYCKACRKEEAHRQYEVKKEKST